jgi:hypothetical protein
LKHTRTGKWIIGHSVKEKQAKDIGGCSDDPLVIDVKRRILKLC